MKDKFKIVIALLILIILINVATISISAWGIGGGLQAELPVYNPPTETMTLPNSYPADTSQPSVPDTPAGPVENNITITRYSSISGIAFEDYQQITTIPNNVTTTYGGILNNFTATSQLTTDRIGTNQKKDIETETTEKEPGIENVIVELLKGDSAVATTLTDENGEFSFNGIGEAYGAGRYKLRFYYGLVNSDDYMPEESNEYILPLERNNLNLNSGIIDKYSVIKNIIKYNAQDYTATQIGNSYSAYDSFEKRILESGKAYSQVFLLLDCSGSVAEDNEKIFNLEKEAAKETVNNLLSDNEVSDNIAIGIVGFYNDVVIVKQLTNVKKDLIDCLNNITLDVATTTSDPSIEIIAVNNFMNWSKQPYGTNIGHAVVETNKLFITDEENADNSNRTIVLLSDGYPSAHNNVEQLYANDEETVLYEKFVRVTEETNKNIKEIVENGTKLISVISKPDDSDTIARELIDKTFKNDQGEYIGNYKEISLSNEEEYKNYIGTEIPRIVEEGKQEGEILVDTTENGIFNEMEKLASRTADNIERRKSVNNYFSIINNEKANWFNIVDKLKGTINDLTIIDKYYNDNSTGGEVKYKNYVKEFTKETFMYAESGEYEINVVTETSDAVSVTGSSGTATYNKEDYDNIFIVDVNYENENLVLEKRTGFKLGLEKKLTGIRVTLNDGSILKEDIRTDFTDINDSAMLTYPLVMDEELMHGAKLEIEYTIRVTNLSDTNIQTGKEISIIDYINGGDSNLHYDLDANLLSEPEHTNGYYLWETVGKEDLINNKSVNNDVLEILEDNAEYLIAKYNITDYNNSYDEHGNNTYPINPFIPKNGYVDIKLVGLTTLTSGLEEDDLTYSNTAEILSYSNLIGRRIDYEINREQVDKGLEKHIIFLSDDSAISVIPGNYKFGDNHEIDSDTSIEVSIIPPFGEEIKQYTLIVMLGIVFVVGIIFIKKKVLK